MPLPNIKELEKTHTRLPKKVFVDDEPSSSSPIPKKQGRTPDAKVEEDIAERDKDKIMENYKKTLRLYLDSDKELSDKDLEELFYRSIQYENETIKGGNKTAAGARVAQPMKKIKEMWEDMLTSDQMREAWKELREDRKLRKKEERENGDDDPANNQGMGMGFNPFMNPYMNSNPFFANMQAQGVDLSKVDPNFMAGAMWAGSMGGTNKNNAMLNQMMQQLYQASIMNALSGRNGIANGGGNGNRGGDDGYNRAVAETLNNLTKQFTEFMSAQQQTPVNPYANPQYMAPFYQLMNQPDRNGNSEMGMVLKELLRRERGDPEMKVILKELATKDKSSDNLMIQFMNQQQQNFQMFMAQQTDAMAKALFALRPDTNPKDEFKEAIDFTRGLLGDQRQMTELDARVKIEDRKIDLEERRLLHEQQMMDRQEQRDHETNLAYMKFGNDAIGTAAGLVGQAMGRNRKMPGKSKGLSPDEIREDDLDYL